MWFTYIIECQNGDLYTGITDNVERRFTEHVQGKGGKFTRDIGAIKVLYKERFPSKEEARKREVQIKGWTRRKKFSLNKGDLRLLKQL